MNTHHDHRRCCVLQLYHITSLFPALLVTPRVRGTVNNKLDRAVVLVPRSGDHGAPRRRTSTHQQL